MSYHHLSTYERGRIEAFHRLGYSNRKIAFLIERHRSCIDREIKRNTGAARYQAEVAGQNYINRRKRSKPRGKVTQGLVEIIEQRLQETWSPEQISNVATPGMACFKSIYNWIYAGKLHRTNVQNLRHKGKRRKADKRGRFALGLPISQRPPEVKHRETFGHWELDTMVSSRGESKGCFATFVERKSRLYTALKISDRSAESMQAAITQLYRTMPKGAFKTATTDRGKEFACYGKIKDELGLTLYFADAYSAWQRGSNENCNGLLREFYPKKTDLAKVDQKKLTHNLFLINSRPRKCLNWKSPIQVFLHEVAHLN
jgi:IS30 family transposase